MIIGYARVSTDGQTLEAQQSALRAAGATKVFSEKISGAITDRKALARAIAALSSGDTLIVTRRDRLAPEHGVGKWLHVMPRLLKARAYFGSSLVASS
jgi:DNA invertase Pin-like site-specific DNA recombinase